MKYNPICDSTEQAIFLPRLLPKIFLVLPHWSKRKRKRSLKLMMTAIYYLLLKRNHPTAHCSEIDNFIQKLKILIPAFKRGTKSLYGEKKITRNRNEEMPKTEWKKYIFFFFLEVWNWLRRYTTFFCRETTPVHSDLKLITSFGNCVGTRPVFCIN